MSERTTDEALGRLGALVDAARRAESDLDDELVATREAGATYQQLADVLGVGTYQAAQQRLDAARKRIERRRS